MAKTAKTDRLEAVIAVVDESSKNIEKITKSYDNMSRELLRLRANMDKMKRSAAKQTEMKIKTKKAKAQLDKLKTSLDHVKDRATQTMNKLKSLGTVAGTAIAAGFGVAIKSGLELEKQMTSIQHFIGVNNKGMSEKQAGVVTDQYIQDMRKYAAKAPFSSNDVMAAGSRAVGVAGGDTKLAKDLVKVSGDMAALTPGKTMMDAMEALADAKTGEMERLKEFGFKVSAEEFKAFVGKGKNDNLTDDETMKAYEALVNQKLNPYFSGGVDKISQTTGGKLNTIMSNVQTGLQDAGYNMIESIDPKILDKLVKQSAKLGKTLGGLGAKMINAFVKVKPHISAIGKALAIATTAVVTFEVSLAALTIMSTIIKLFKAWRAGTLAQTMAQLGLNAAMLANPLTWVAVAIAAVVAIGVALYLNWEKITKTAEKLYKTVTKCFKKIGENIMEAMQPVFDFFGSLMDAWDKFRKSLEDFKMPKIGVPKFLGGDGFIQTEKSTKKKGKKKAIGGVIPYDNYPALLHRGEKVQTQQEVNQDKRQQGGNTYQFGDIIIQGSGNSKQDAKSILNAIVAEIEMVGGAGA